MGHRTLKRVPLDFQWPLGEVWKGYINPHQGPETCLLCDGTGYNAETKQISDDFYDFADTGRRWRESITQDEVQALVHAGRLWEFTRVPLNDEQREVVRKKMASGGNSWLPYDNGRIPTADEVNEWNKHDFGHDAINQWILIRVRAKRLGVYGKCPKCRGKGEKFPKNVPHRPYNSWKWQEPPTGDGYQLWETTSEGSPVSPVFETAEALAKWCAEHATVFADVETSYENWLSMFVEDSVGAGSFLVITGDKMGVAVNM